MNAQVQVLSETPDLRLELRSRNNVLWHAIFDIYDSVAAFCRAHDCQQSTVGAFLNLRLSPHGRQMELRPAARQLCEATGFDAETLFPTRLYTGKFGIRIAEVDSVRFVSLESAQRLALPAVQDDLVLSGQMRASINETLDTLRPRERAIIVKRFGLDGEGENTLGEIADQLHISRGRVGQIEAKALRKLRHRSRRKKLSPFLASSRWSDQSEPERLPNPVEAPFVAAASSQSTTDTNASNVFVARSDFVTTVTVSIEQLRSGAWITNDTPPPLGGRNPIITNVRVIPNDVVDRVSIVVYGTAERVFPY